MKKALVLAMALAAVCIMPSCEKDPKPNETTTGTLNGHEWVDLGLPSGTLWATCNVGADTPESYGDYFAWAETEPKTTFTWINYKYCNGAWDKLTKYCTMSKFGDNGFTDDLTELQLQDDAARVKWGNGWLTPSKEQWTELYKNTTHEWMTQNGVTGCLVTGSNGNCIFLPAAGQYVDAISLDGQNASYWSSSLFTDMAGEAWLFDFNAYSDSEYSGNFGYICGGLPVRPVCSKK